MSDSAMLKTAFNLPPAKAIKYFESKGYQITFDWHDMLREAHTKAFTVAGVTSINVLADIRKTIEKAQKTGMTLESFKKELRPTLEKRGWWGKKTITRSDGSKKEVDLSEPWRLKTIFQTNMKTSYMSGIYKDLKDASDVMPYWRYVAVMDGRTREAHATLHGKSLRSDDPFWDMYFPPNGWGCRCSVEGVTERRFKSENLKLSESRSMSSAAALTTSDGWDYNPGQSFYKPDPKDYPVDFQKKVEQINHQAKITDDEQRAVNFYLSANSYMLNEKLRTGAKLDESEQKTVDVLDRLIARRPKYKGEVSRSLKFFNETATNNFVKLFVEEQNIAFKSFMSTTADSKLYNPAGQVQIFLVSETAADMIEFNPSEQEVLYKRGQKFLVLKVEKKADKWLIYLKENES